MQTGEKLFMLGLAVFAASFALTVHGVIGLGGYFVGIYIMLALSFLGGLALA